MSFPSRDTQQNNLGEGLAIGYWNMHLVYILEYAHVPTSCMLDLEVSCYWSESPAVPVRDGPSISWFIFKYVFF
jgi:hypothetical protein